MDLNSLIKLAEEVASLEDLSSDESFTLVERYSSEIASWISEKGKIIDDSGKIENREQIEYLSSLHDRIVERIKTAKGEVSDSMKKFKVRSKAIKAYSGINSRRISNFKAKQG